MAMRRRLVTVPVVALAFHDQIATVKTADAQMVLVDRGFLRRVPWRRHDVVVVRSPCDRRQVMIANLRHLEGECARPLTQGDFLTWTPVPRGHCWIEGDDPKGGDSTEFGPVPLALIEGRVAAVLWPPSRMRWLERASSLNKLN